MTNWKAQAEALAEALEEVAAPIADLGVVYGTPEATRVIQVYKAPRFDRARARAEAALTTFHKLKEADGDCGAGQHKGA